MKLSDKIKWRLLTWCRSHAYDIVLPNYYWFDYEMDICKITQSGYIVEYEIKISRADYKADFNKNFYGYTKHDMLRSGKGANRFYFVVPENLVQISEVPEHCGLIYYSEYKITIIKNAKLLHRNHFTNYKRVAHKLADREGFLQRKLINLRNKNNYLKSL